MMSESKYTIMPAELDDLAGIIHLLDKNELPSSDLISSQVRLWVLKESDTVIGCIGLEVYGSAGFLRSLAIDANYRSLGLGKNIIAYLIQYAHSIGLTSLHLLTTSAELLFSKLGFEKLDRSQAPDTIKSNKQFTQLCSSVAVYMMKEIG